MELTFIRDKVEYKSYHLSEEARDLLYSCVSTKQ